MTAQLLKAKSLGAQAILIWGIGPELAAVSNGMAKLGFKVPLIGGWPLSMSNYLDNAGANGNGTLMPQTFIEEPITPRAKAFIDAYHKAYGVTRIPSPVSAAQGYDAVLIFAAAVKQAGSTDSLKIRDALEDLKEPVDGVIATWNKPYSKWNPTDVHHPRGLPPRADHHGHGAGRPRGLRQRGRQGPPRQARRQVERLVPGRRRGPPPRLTRRPPDTVPFSIVAQIAVSGALMGLVYALVAYGFQLTYATSKSINFGQGELVMVSAFVSLTLTATSGLPLLGGGAARPALRRAARPGWWSGPRCGSRWSRRARAGSCSPSSSASSSSRRPRTSGGATTGPSPPPSPTPPSTLLGVDVTGREVSVLVGVLAIMGIIEVFKRKTLLGKAFEAVSADRDAGRAHGHLGHPHGDALLRPLRHGGGGGWHPGLAHHHGRADHGLGHDPQGLLGGGGGRARVGLRRGAGRAWCWARWRGWPASTSAAAGARRPGLVLLILALAVRPTGVFGKAVIRKV